MAEAVISELGKVAALSKLMDGSDKVVHYYSEPGRIIRQRLAAEIAVTHEVACVPKREVRIRESE